MRNIKVFTGSSHPTLTYAICERLGLQPSRCELTKFANGETSVSIGDSIRNHDVYIVQSGSRKINDSVMELLIMIQACKGGSAKSITAVVPYFPYSRQSKKKSHRGAITARLLANLLSVAGVDKVICVDLHAAPMQGFFGKPVDNLQAEPLIARWIRNHIPSWQNAVVVAKNAGGSKRVTSFADVLKLSFGIITTDRRRQPRTQQDSSMDASLIFGNGGGPGYDHPDAIPRMIARSPPSNPSDTSSHSSGHIQPEITETSPPPDSSSSYPLSPTRRVPFSTRAHLGHQASPLSQSTTLSSSPPVLGGTEPSLLDRRRRSHTSPVIQSMGNIDLTSEENEYNDHQASEVITGRLYQGHIVDDDFSSPNPHVLHSSNAGFSNWSAPRTPQHEAQDPMTSSTFSIGSAMRPDGLGGSGGDANSDDEEAELKDPELEHTVTLVGNVRDRMVFIMDDMIDRAESWIAAAETLIKRGGAKKVYCIGTHGLFGGDCLEELEACECIEQIIICNTFPIEPERVRECRKLVVLDVAGMIAEAVRRTHYGESMHMIYQYYQD